jgi:hypothetical protein
LKTPLCAGKAKYWLDRDGSRRSMILMAEESAVRRERGRA